MMGALSFWLIRPDTSRCGGKPLNVVRSRQNSRKRITRPLKEPLSAARRVGTLPIRLSLGAPERLSEGLGGGITS